MILRRKRTNNESILQAHLSNVKSLIKKESWAAIRKYLKILSNEYNFKAAKYCLEHQYYNELPDIENFVYKLSKETGVNINRCYIGDEDEKLLKYNHMKHPILLRTWNKSRIISNLISINKNNVLSVKKGRCNIYNSYLFPFDLILCGGGNHSQLSALLENEGESFISIFIDMRPLYEKVKFNGNDFILFENNKIVNVITHKSNINLETKYLIGIYFEIGRLLMNCTEYFPNYILENIQ